MNQLLPTLPSAATPIDYAQRRYRWVGPKGRHWYRAVLLTVMKRYTISLFE